MRNSRLKIQVTLAILLISSLFIGIKSCKEEHESLPKEQQIYIKKKVCDSSVKYQKEVKQKPPDSIYNFVLKPDVTMLMDDLIYYNVREPEIVLRQAVWETGWFKSTVCKKYKNLFGFRTTNGYLRFNTWQNSVIYYKKWQTKHYKEGDYYQFLIDIGYAEDSLYTDHLKSLKIDYTRKLQGISSDTLQLTQ